MTTEPLSPSSHSEAVAAWQRRAELTTPQWGRGNLMVLAAFRYCLGRQTYLVGDCVHWLLAILPRLDVGTVRALRRDLDDAYRRADAGARYALGDAKIDRREWDRLRAALAVDEAELRLWRTTTAPEPAGLAPPAEDPVANGWLAALADAYHAGWAHTPPEVVAHSKDKLKEILAYLAALGPRHDLIDKARMLAEDWHEGMPEPQRHDWSCRAASVLLAISQVDL